MTKQRTSDEPLFRMPNISPEQWFEACRMPFDTWLELNNATMSCTERMLAFTSETQSQIRSAAEALAKARDPQEAMSLQGMLMNAYWQGFLQYWKNIAELAQKNQMECAQILERRCAQAGGGWKPGGSAAGQGLAGSMSSGMQSAFEAARKANDAILHAWTSGFAMPGGESEQAAAHRKAA